MTEEQVRVEGVREALRAFRGLPKEASDTLRDRSQALAVTLADKAATAARRDSPQSALVAETVRARRDRIPKIAAGGAKRVGSSRSPAHKILFGAELGSGRLPQFRPHRGPLGYWLFSTVERERGDVAEALQGVLDDVAQEFAD